MNCSYCGAAVPLNRQNCPMCGAHVSNPNDEAGKCDCHSCTQSRRSPLERQLDMTHSLQNWQGECGRGPSLEHPATGGYCQACERLKCAYEVIRKQNIELMQFHAKLGAADALARAVKDFARHADCIELPETACRLDKALAAYEKARKG